MSIEPTTDVDEICTDEELDEYLGGQIQGQGTHMLPVKWGDTSRPAREHAYRRLLRALQRRSPPITESDLTDKTELKHAIIYGAAEHLYRLAMTGANDAEVFFHQSKLYGQKFEAEISGLTPTLQDGIRGNAGSIGIFRR